MSNSKKSTISEFKWIEMLSSNIKLSHNSTYKGIGDDAAIINQNGQKIVISSDSFLENIHFDLSYTPLSHLGYKSIISTISDIVAMNVKPSHILTNIAVPNNLNINQLNTIYDGILKACEFL